MPETAGGEAPEAAFARFLSAGEVRLQVCDDCGRQVFPPRGLCPRCGSIALTWTPADPHAVVYSVTTVRRRPDRGGDHDVCLVELAGGARMLSRVVDTPAGQVAIGDRVTATVEKIGDELVVAFARGGAAR